MSHVSEGILHAYLDAALDELPGGEADAVRDHLAGCTECSIRLAEAREVRDEAIAILGGTLPSLDMPPLEDLRARAAAMPGAPRRASNRLYRLGWAASVVLAVGAGWTLRGGQAVPIGMMDPLDRPLDTREILPLDPRPESDIPTQANELIADAIAATVSTDVVAEAPRPPVSEDVSAPSSGPVPVESAARRETVAGARVEAPVEETMTDATPRAGLRAMTADAPVVFRQLADSALARADQVQGSPPSALSTGVGVSEAELVAIAPPEERAVASDVQSAERGRREAVRSAQKATAGLSLVPSSHSDDEDPDRHVGDAPPMVIGGLELIDMAWISEGVTAGGVRVLQALEDGETLELLHLPEGVDPDELEPFPDDGKTGVITPRDGGWLIMRANRTVEELQSLLERLDGVS